MLCDETSLLEIAVTKGVDTTEYLWFVSTNDGPLEDLTGMICKIHVRDKKSSLVKLDELTTANGRAVIPLNVRSRFAAIQGAETVLVDPIAGPILVGMQLRFGSLTVTLTEEAPEGVDFLRTLPLSANLPVNVAAGLGVLKLIWPASVTNAVTWTKGGFDIMLAPAGQTRPPRVEGVIALREAFTHGL